MALLAVVVYSVLVIGTMLTSGLAYDELFETADNAWKSAVPALGIGAAFLVALTAYARWDFVWRDPARLRMSPLLWAPVVLMVAGFLLRFAGLEWSAIERDLLIAIVLAGIGVGFAEELLFRGIVLRCLRTGGRSEARAALITAVGFGTFHLTNLALGTGATVLVQVFLATMSGFTLYLARRSTGLIVTGMVIHGLWDISTFFSGTAAYVNDDLPFNNISNGLMFASLILIVIAWVASSRTDRHLRWQDDGPVISPGAPLVGHHSAQV